MSQRLPNGQYELLWDDANPPQRQIAIASPRIPVPKFFTLNFTIYNYSGIEAQLETSRQIRELYQLLKDAGKHPKLTRTHEEEEEIKL